MPILTPNAIEAALGAVIERVNTTGALCHEETIGMQCQIAEKLFLYAKLYFQATMRHL